jgi:hypothetical protein
MAISCILSAMEIIFKIAGAFLMASIGVLQFFTEWLSRPWMRWIVCGVAFVGLACFAVGEYIGAVSRRKWESGLAKRIVDELSDKISEREALEAAPTPALVPAPKAIDSLTTQDPRIYLSDISRDGDSMFMQTPFVIENLGGDVAHNIQIQPITFGYTTIQFPLVDVLKPGVPFKVIPTIPHANMDKHSVLPVLTEAWNEKSKNDEKFNLDFSFAVAIYYDGFSGAKLETDVEVTYSYMQQRLQENIERRNIWRDGSHNHKIFRITHKDFRVRSN